MNISYRSTSSILLAILFSATIGQHVQAGVGCCSMSYKLCDVSWCGSSISECENCGGDAFIFLEDGERSRCLSRWSSCTYNLNACCDGATCTEISPFYSQCLPSDGSPIVVTTPAPTNPPTSPSTIAPIVAHTRSPTNTPSISLYDLMNGKATFYGGAESGNACGYIDLPKVSFPYGFSVAIGGETFDEGYGCGACFEVSCVGAFGDNPDCLCNGEDSVIVQATDQCPECEPNHFDLNTNAFANIVGSVDMAGTCGIIETAFRRVSCNFDGNIKIRSKSGTSGWWYGLHVDDIAGYGAISTIKLREAGRRQVGQDEFDIVCDKSSGPSFWLCQIPNRQIFAPLDVSLTDSAGRMMVEINVITNLSGDQEFDFGNNFDSFNTNDSPPQPVAPNPTPKPSLIPEPVIQPTPSPTPTSPTTPSPPVPDGILLSTDKAMNAWDVFLGLDFMTHVNSLSPPDFALVASGGAAGSGNLVVSESQSYALLITGTILASWDTHAGKVSGSTRSDVVKSFEGYFNFWKQMCIDSSNKSSNCQSGGNYCQSSSGSKNVCLPDWRHYKTGGSESTGPAPDADEDAIVGIILAVKALENDTNKPGWWDEARLWADASATAFFNFNVDKSRGDRRLVLLGCWGGYDSAGNNPSYHSPGSYRVMKDYQKSFPNNQRVGYDAISQAEWNKLIDTSYEVLRAVQCSDDGALVPNWATISTDSDGNIINTGGSFSGSGTPQYEYGSEAARTTFRVALDAALYPQMSTEWSPYLSQFNWRLDADFDSNSRDWSSSAFPNCRSDGANQDTNMFVGGWRYNAFIYGPTFSALIASTSDIVNADDMLDAAGRILSKPLPNSYYPRAWAMISNLMISGAMESAGNVLRESMVQI